MALTTVEGLVLRTRNLGEADKIVTLLTLERGKLRVVARGARRARSRLLAVTQPFSHGKYMLFINSRSLHTLSQGELERPFRRLREELVPLAYASYFAEWVDVGVPEEQVAEEAFETLVAALLLLEQGLVPPSLVSRWFELHILDVLGFCPELEECVQCRSPLGRDARGDLGFSVTAGGVKCAPCASNDRRALPMGLSAWQSMRYLLGLAASKLGTFRLSEADNAFLERLLVVYMENRFDTRLNSLAFLQSVR